MRSSVLLSPLMLKVMEIISLYIVIPRLMSSSCKLHYISPRCTSSKKGVMLLLLIIIDIQQL